MKHFYRNGELARIINYGDMSGKECVVIGVAGDTDRLSEYYDVLYRGQEFSFHYSKLEPIQFKEDIAPSFDEDLFEVE